MKTKKGLLTILLIGVIAVIALAACRSTGVPPTQPTPGPETGVYRCDTAGGVEHFITLHSGNQFTLSMVNEAIKTGEYTLTGTVLALKFKDEPDGINATLENESISMTYSGLSLIFLKQVMRTVSFNSNQGTAVASVSVMNGRYVPLNSKPLNPTRDGFEFIDWYKDAGCTDLFRFGEDIITSDKILYAYWAQPVVGRQEFVINFNWGFENAPENPASMQTIGGKLYTQPSGMVRSGYTFCGWWISMYQDKEMLTYPLTLANKTGETVFDESMTLYALWQENASTPASPLAAVSSTQIVWPSVSGANSYRINIVNPAGITLVDAPVASVPTSVTYPFTFTGAGDYIVTVTTVGSSSSIPAIRYYKNKALAKVSVFEIINSSVIRFNKVKNATEYFITVKSGNKLHNQSAVALGNSTVYDFSHCEMQPGGLIFTVEARGDGWTSSVSNTYVFDRIFPAVSEITVDKSTLLATWAAVPGATNYSVTVKSGDKEYTTDNINTTSFSLKEFDAGSLQIYINPKADGYNSPAPVWHTYLKANLAAPRNVRLEGTVVKWSPVKDAATYTVKIGNLEITTQPTHYEYALTPDEVRSLKLFGDDDYMLSVRTNGVSPSLYSDPVTIINYMPEEISYFQGVVSWKYVLGASKYEITVNLGTTVQKLYTTNANSIRVTLTQTQINTIALMVFDEKGFALSVDDTIVKVYAYTITFNVGGFGSVDTAKLHKALGDPLDDFPATKSITRKGYNFENWYTSPGGPQQNAKRFTDKYFTGGDIVLYAGWTAHVYNIKLDAGDGVVSDDTPDITFESFGKIEVPVINGGGFVGWYITPDGAYDFNPKRLTNELGNLLEPWSYYDADEMVIYAFYAQIFTFIGSTAYEISLGQDYHFITNAVVPDEYNGKPVTDIGLFRYPNLESVTFGKNITYCNSDAFDSDRRLQNIYVHKDNSKYSSVNGVLHDKNGTELLYFPQGRTRAAIPDSTTVIGSMAFRNFTTLKGIAIPGHVKTISSYAFKNCTGLADITLHKGIETIDDYAFSGCIGLTEVTIPADLTYLGVLAFEDCARLSRVVFAGGSVRDLTLGEKVFYDNYNIREVIFEEGSLVQNISNNAFYGNDAFTEITIPASVTVIDDNAFDSCYKLEKIIIAADSQLKRIGANAVRNTSFLKEITFKGTSMLETVHAGIFQNHKSIEKITLPQNLISVDDYAFEGCTDLKTLTFGASNQFTTIGNGVFDGCVNLAVITLPANATNIVAAMFLDCVKLEEIRVIGSAAPALSAENGVLYNANKTALILYPALKSGTYTLPAGVTAIREGALQNSAAIESFSVAAGNTAFTAVNSVLFRNNGTTLLRYPAAHAQTTYTVPGSVTAIDAFAFRDAQNLASITFAAQNLKNIGAYAFDGCINLETLSLPSGLDSIGAYAFNRCFMLVTLQIPGGTTYIGANTFAGSGMTSIIIPDSVIEIGANAFRNSNRLESVTFNGVSKLEIIGTAAFQNCTALKTIVLPASVRSIGDNAFSGITGDEFDITLNEGLQTIGMSAFRGSSGEAFKDIEIPGTVTKLGDYAFYAVSTDNSKKLLNITFKGKAGGAAALTMGEHVFANNPRLETVTFETDSNVQNIGDYAFQNCAGNTSSIYEENKSYFTTITIPATVTEIGAFAFEGRLVELWGSETPESVLSEVIFATGSRLKSIGAYAFNRTAIENLDLSGTLLENIDDGAFRHEGDLQGLVDIKFPATLKSIGDYAFEEQRSLQSLILPEGLETIGASAFYNASGIRGEFKVPDSVTAIGDSAFHSAGGMDWDTWQPLAQLVINGTSNLIKIGHNAFGYSNFGGSDLTLPDTLRILGDNAFCQLKMTGCLTIPGGITTFGIDPFNNTSFSSVVLAEGMTSVPAFLLQGNGFTEITISAGITSIGENAFTPNWSMSLQKITFAPGSKLKASDIGAGAFRYYEVGATTIVNLPAEMKAKDIGSIFGQSIQNYEITDPASPYSIKDGILYDKAGTTLLSYPTGRTSSCIIPAGTTAIGEYAFFNPGLNYIDYGPPSVTIIDSVQTIGDYAFKDCTGLESVIINATTSNLTSIGAGAFIGCTNGAFKTFTIPDKLTTIGEGAFNNSSVSDIIINKNHAYFELIDETIFRTKAGKIILLTSASKEMTIPYSITAITEYMFYNRTNLEIINIHSDVTSIGNYAFVGSSLKEVNFIGKIDKDGNIIDKNAASKLTSIGQSAFQNLGDLKSINIPASVKTIGNHAFDGSGVRTINFGADSRLESIGNSAFVLPTSYDYLPPDYIPIPKDPPVRIILPGRLVTIGNNAFQGVYFSTENPFVIPASVTTIGTNAFSNASLSEVIVEDNSRLRLIGSEAFSGSSLKSIVFGENCMLQQISNKAFDNTSLTSITLPDQLVEIGPEAFAGSTLKAFVVSENSLNFATEDGVLLNKAKNKLVLYPGCRDGATYRIPNSVKIIGKGSFLSQGWGAGATAFRTIILHNRVTTIEEEAFQYGSINVNIPLSVINVGHWAFKFTYATVNIEYASKADLPLGWNEAWYDAGLTINWNAIMPS